MGARGGKPFQRIKRLLTPAIFGPVNHIGFFRDVGHPLLGKRCPDNISGDVLHGLIVAGLTGSTYWGYLYVGRLWTEQRFRNKGLGSRLLADAEQEALRRGCHSAHLMTGDFNALPFYQKRGYTLFGELPDMPPGHTQYFLHKKLQEDSK